MSEKWYNLVASIGHHLYGDEIEGAIGKMEKIICMPNIPPIIIKASKLDFTTQPDSVASAIEAFLRQEGAQSCYQVRSVYIELSAIPWSISSLHFDLFGYDTQIGADCCELDDWRSSDFPSFSLCGLENLKDCFQADGDQGLEDAQDYLSLLVLYKFQRLIWRAVRLVGWPEIDFLASAHDLSEVPCIWRRRRI